MKSSACCLVSVGWAHPISEAGSRAAWEEKKHASVTFTMPLTVGSHAPVDAGLRLSRGLGLWVVSEVKVGGRPWSKDYGGPRPDPQTRPKTTPASCRGCFFLPTPAGAKGGRGKYFACPWLRRRILQCRVTPRPAIGHGPAACEYWRLGCKRAWHSPVAQTMAPCISPLFTPPNPLRTAPELPP